MRRSKAMINRMLIAAPWATVATLALLSSVLPNRAAVGADGEIRRAEIARAIADVPAYIGRWSGADDRTMAPEAQRLLKPNGLLSRRYTSPGGPWVHLVVVHCGDARDMIGHYPPVCYPSAGWTEALPVGHRASDPANPDRVLTVFQQPFPVREYDFKGYLEDGREDVIRILNAFILPDGTATREIDDINRQSERLSVAVQGVAQVQVITSARVSVEDAMSAAEEIFSGMSGLFEALQFKRGATQ